MLRITTDGSAAVLRLVLEGRLAGPWVVEADAAWTRACATRAGRTLEVDLREVLAIDPAGRDLVARMAHDGARFLACGCAMREVVREIAEAHAPRRDDVVSRVE